MTGRSLSCSPKGIQQAKKALIRYSLTQKALAEDLGITRQPVGKFFTGKPVDRNLFVQICDRLDLEWEEVVAQAASEAEVEANQDISIDITAIVQEVREKVKPLIQERCGTMRVLDMPGLLEYICDDTVNHVSSHSSIVKTQFISSIQDVITYGKALILLDGLDEVREEDNSRILKEIREFSDSFQNNQFVMTCRIAAQEYTFEKFTEVEVADFDDEQINNFANKWFNGKAVTSETFIRRLEDNNRIKQLAVSPLLLTLLCLAFEESGDFPANRSELYKEGLDALLKKWDAKRGIQREQIYKKLSVQRKEDLLSKIAITTFEDGDYFFKQKLAEKYITDYIRNLPGANTDEEALQLDSEEVLRSIEHHHGLVVARAKAIYSFSHLTFHEYFTAREFVVVRQSSEEALQNLVSHITVTRWREVFLLAVGMSPNADNLLLLMKQKIDMIVSRNKKLQQFLMWLSEQSQSVNVNYQPAAVRAFYFDLILVYYPAITRILARDLNIEYEDILALNLEKAGTHAHLLYLASLRTDIINLDLDNINNLNRARAFVRSLHYNLLLDCVFELKLGQALQQLKEQLPNPNSNEEIFKQWWQDKVQIWCEQLRIVMFEYRKIFHDWQFSQQHHKVLQQYYQANLLLVDCLNSDCYVSREVRQYIENTLLLPIEQIQNHYQQS